jgi:hypothetical protein
MVIYFNPDKYHKKTYLWALLLDKKKEYDKF